MVTDFGVAKALQVARADASADTLTEVGIALGTPAYMAPEQHAADPATDRRADIYAFGVLAYEVLTGSPPFTGRTVQSLQAAHAAEAPVPLAVKRASIPPELVALVMRCLEKRPADRPQGAEEIVRELDAIVASIQTTTPPPRRAVSQPHARRTGIVAVAAFALTAVSWLAVRGVPGRAGASASDGIRPTSVAVLYLDNASRDTNDVYLADGLSEAIMTRLGQVGRLEVASRFAVVRYQTQSTPDPAAVGRALHVAHLVSGTVRRLGGRLIVRVELVQAATGRELWSNAGRGRTVPSGAGGRSVVRARARETGIRLWFAHPHGALGRHAVVAGFGRGR